MCVGGGAGRRWVGGWLDGRGRGLGRPSSWSRVQRNAHKYLPAVGWLQRSVPPLPSSRQQVPLNRRRSVPPPTPPPPPHPRPLSVRVRRYRPLHQVSLPGPGNHQLLLVLLQVRLRRTTFFLKGPRIVFFFFSHFFVVFFCFFFGRRRRVCSTPSPPADATAPELRRFGAIFRKKNDACDACDGRAARAAGPPAKRSAASKKGNEPNKKK